MRIGYMKNQTYRTVLWITFCLLFASTTCPTNTLSIIGDLKEPRVCFASKDLGLFRIGKLLEACAITTLSKA
jgi:hypothetical protein